MLYDSSMKLKEKPKKLYIGFRGTKEEKEEVESKANKRGYNISDYLRFLINNDGGNNNEQ